MKGPIRSQLVPMVTQDRDWRTHNGDAGDADDSKLDDRVLAAGYETQLRQTERGGLNCDE